MIAGDHTKDRLFIKDWPRECTTQQAATPLPLFSLASFIYLGASSSPAQVQLLQGSGMHLPDWSFTERLRSCARPLKQWRRPHNDATPFSCRDSSELSCNTTRTLTACSRQITAPLTPGLAQQGTCRHLPTSRTMARSCERLESGSWLNSRLLSKPSCTPSYEASNFILRVLAYAYHPRTDTDRPLH